MKRLLKGFLVTLAVLLVVLVVAGLVLTLDWPWWVGIFILVGLAGVWLGFVFLEKVLLRQREERFVQQVIAQDDAYLKGLSDQERDQAREVQERWREAVTALKQSHLKKLGNPLYVLPWYLVIGESGSGKTTAIQSARLSAPFAEMTRTSGLSGTRNCDWWFFDQAVIIDTAGRYAIPVDEGRDKEEWTRFLAQLAKFRKKEPLNGLVVSLPADKLLQGDTARLEEDGRAIRRRADELMRVLGARFPVYVLVTKCDLIQGMTQFCDQLPEKAQQQAMGFVNRDLKAGVEDFLGRAMQAIGTRLRELRLLLLHRGGARAVDPALLLFPEEFEGLTPGLTAFLKAAFQQNPYQETPILRGLFFSSGRQEGSPYSHFLQALGLIASREVLPGTSRGLFLHDFFSRILPKDRRLFAPTQRALDWRRLTRNLGLSAWVALVLAACGLLSFSFVRNLSSLRHIAHEFTAPAVIRGETVTDLATLERFRQAALRVEDQNRNWWIPRMGLPDSKKVELQLKAHFCRQFRKGLLDPLDHAGSETVMRFSAATPGQIIGPHVVHLVRRILLIKARQAGEDLEALEARPQPAYAALLPTAGPHLPEEAVDEGFALLYRHYLVWSSRSEDFNQEIGDLRRLLQYALTHEGARLGWLTDYVDTRTALSPVKLKDFWGDSLAGAASPAVPPCFTRQGKAFIEGLIADIENALPDPALIAGRKTAFLTAYAADYLRSWQAFGAAFREGEAGLAAGEPRRTAAAVMGSDQGPYFNLLSRMAEELGTFSEWRDDTGWPAALLAFRNVRLLADKEALAEESAGLSKAAKKGKDLIGKLEETFSRGEDDPSLRSMMTAASALRDYRAALMEITPVSASRLVAYQTAAQVFSEDPAMSKSPLVAAQNAYARLKAAMATAGGGSGSGAGLVWDLVKGPFDYLWTYVRMETACHLQDLWEQQVLVEVEGISDLQRINELLLGDGGYALQYVKGPGAPFLGRSLDRGYYSKRVMGEAIPFEGAFLSFLTRGARTARPIEQSYAVTIKGLPTDTNPEAHIRPHATRLELQCAAQTFSLANFHYPITEVFKWEPQNCGDVVFTIEVGTLSLVKIYTGNLAFAQFLRDFNRGERTFRPDEFPREASALKQMGISFIRARYQFSGHGAAVKLLAAGPGRAPRTIVRCWDR
ncbi:type VI secretion protein IcmF/TssM N-terminal domain-containing protein [Desulfatiglans anilini]|uniref:type VI secretion protein IcmF/TssM N-terminal domain-containing protein n=1 Tax=Desulfatiglans anilini TaxID=90728 RepID=UPI000402C8BC|nr:type VI secretion protein IcmF/TssM N-terminal domain-containing protein [Desulfatiglans anilini]